MVTLKQDLRNECRITQATHNKM